MTALWVHEIADRFWANVGDTSADFPRDLVDVIMWAAPVTPVELPRLSIDAVNAWLIDRDRDLRLEIPNRRLRACLFATDEHDLRRLLRSGAGDDELAEVVSRAVAGKWAGHGIGQVHFIRPNRSMSQIGG